MLEVQFRPNRSDISYVWTDETYERDLVGLPIRKPEQVAKSYYEDIFEGIQGRSWRLVVTDGHGEAIYRE